MLALQPPATSKNECTFRQVRCLIPYRSFHYGIEVLQGFGGKALAQASLFQRANIQVRRVGLPKPCTSSRSLSPLDSASRQARPANVRGQCDKDDSGFCETDGLRARIVKYARAACHSAVAHRPAQCSGTI